MTELSCIVFMTVPSEVSLLDDVSSVGTVMPHASAKVVDSDLNALPPGSTGELLISGYLVFQGYYKNAQKTEEALVRDSEGQMWMRTGDLVKMSATGRCTIMGRLKDMLKRGTFNFLPGGGKGCLHQPATDADKLRQGERMCTRMTLRKCCRCILILPP